MLKQQFKVDRLGSLAPANPKVIFLRDGEIVLHMRPNNPIFQCRFKLVNGIWKRASRLNLSLRVIIIACQQQLWDWSTWLEESTF